MDDIAHTAGDVIEKFGHWPTGELQRIGRDPGSSVEQPEGQHTESTNSQV